MIDVKFEQVFYIFLTRSRYEVDITLTFVFSRCTEVAMPPMSPSSSSSSSSFSCSSFDDNDDDESANAITVFSLESCLRTMMACFITLGVVAVTRGTAQCQHARFQLSVDLVIQGASQSLFIKIYFLYLASYTFFKLFILFSN